VNNEKIEQLIIDFLQKNGPSCVSGIIIDIYNCEYISDDYMEHMPKVLSAAWMLKNAGKIIMDDPNNPEIPFRLPNQQLSDYRLNA